MLKLQPVPTVHRTTGSPSVLRVNIPTTDRSGAVFPALRQPFRRVGNPSGCNAKWAFCPSVGTQPSPPYYPLAWVPRLSLFLISSRLGLLLETNTHACFSLCTAHRVSPVLSCPVLSCPVLSCLYDKLIRNDCSTVARLLAEPPCLKLAHSICTVRSRTIGFAPSGSSLSHIE